MQNYKVSIAYDGSSFYGFQKQKSRPTVQGKIEEVLDLLIKDEKKIDKELYSSGPYWDYKNSLSLIHI